MSEAGTLDEELPLYIERDVDAEIDDALRSLSETGGMVILVGPAASGKSRTAYQAALRSLPEWRLVVPTSPTDLEYLAAEGMLPAKALVWIDDAERFLPSSPNLSRLIRGSIISRGRGRLIFIATMWPKFYSQIASKPHRRSIRPVGMASSTDTALNEPEVEVASVDLEGQFLANDLTKVARTFFLASQFSERELVRAKLKATLDPRIAQAIDLAGDDGELTRILAATPALLRKLTSPDDELGHAVLTAAIDIGSVGYPLPVAPDLLATVVERYYMDDTQRLHASRDWFKEALSWALHPVSGGVRALQPAASQVGRLDGVSVSDILVEFARKTAGGHGTRLARVRDYLIDASAADACISIGWAAYQEGMTSACRRAWLKAAEGGKSAAMYNLANLAKQEGNVDDFLYWHMKSWDSGQTDSATELGLYFQQAASNSEAEAWYRRAADSGSPRAMFNLGILYTDLGNEAAAIQFYERAASLGDVDSKVNLAYILHKKGDSERSEALYRSAANAGSAMAMSNLGIIAKKRGNIDEATNWFTLAANQSYSGGMLGLGNIAGDRDDVDEAIRWYTKAADLGEVEASNNLGVLLERVGRTQDALESFEVGARAGDSRAMANLGIRLLRVGRSEEGLCWLRRSHDKGCPLGTVTLADIYLVGGFDEIPIGWFRDSISQRNATLAVTLSFVLVKRLKAIVVLREFVGLVAVAGHISSKESSLAAMLIGSLVQDPAGAELLESWVAEADLEKSRGLLMIASHALQHIGRPEASRECVRRSASAGDLDWVYGFGIMLVHAMDREGLDELAAWCRTKGFTEAEARVERMLAYLPRS
jgi:TPR repeat protein